jgi:hypothetical protein
VPFMAELSDQNVVKRCSTTNLTAVNKEANLDLNTTLRFDPRAITLKNVVLNPQAPTSLFTSVYDDS